MDKLAWGYILATIVLGFSGTAMLMEVMTVKQFMVSVAAAGVLSGATSSLRALFEKQRVADASAASPPAPPVQFQSSFAAPQDIETTKKPNGS